MTDILWWLFQTSVTAAVLILVIAIACRCLRRWPAVQHALWVIVLVKLLTPPVVSWPWTARDVLSSSDAHEIATEKPGKQTHVEPVSNTDSTAVPIRLPLDDVVSSYSERRFADFEKRLSAEATTPAAISWTQTRIPALFGLWLAGGLVALIWQLRSALRARRVVAGCRAAPRSLQREVEQIAEMLGMRPIPTRISARISSPFVCCFGRPLLLWPESLCDEIEKYHSVIAHELAHVKRKDHWVAWLVLFAGCLWWWNPLFWLLRRRIAETAETACDALAISALPDERTQFAETLLHLSQRVAETKTPAPALGAGTGKRQTFKRRFSMILNERVNAKLPKTGLLVALLLAALALPGWPLRPSSADEPAADKAAAVETISAKEIQTLKHEARLGAGSGNVRSVVWSPDGRTLASTTHDVFLWSRDGTELKRYSDPAVGGFLGGPKFGVAFSPDGKQLAVGASKRPAMAMRASDMTARVLLFDANTLELKRKLDASLNSWVRPVAFSPDGKLLLGGSGSMGEKKMKGSTAVFSTGAAFPVWDVARGTLIVEADDYKWDHVRAIAFSPNGKLLATGNQNRVTVRDPETWEEKKVLEKSLGGMGLSFSPDGKTLAVANRHNVVKLFDVASGKLLRSLKHPKGAWMKAVAFSPDGKLLATGGSNGPPKAGRKSSTGSVLSLWDATSGKRIQELKGHDLQVNSIAFCPKDPNLFASAGEDSTVRIWRITRTRK